MPIKTVVCCICGAEVTKRQSLYCGEGKRCCRIHQEELRQMEAKVKELVQKVKEKFISEITSDLETNLYRHTEKSIQNFFSSKFAEACKEQPDFSKHVAISDLKSLFQSKLDEIIKTRLEMLKKDYGKTRLFISKAANDIHRAWFICLYKLNEDRRIPDEVEAREFLTRYFERHAKLSILIARDSELEEKLIAQLDVMGKPSPTSYIIGR